jgi:hypothetical protein
MRYTFVALVLIVVCIGGFSYAVERRSCRCGFTAAGDCKPCSGSGGAVVRDKGCMYGYDEAGNCLKEDKAIMKRCLCGYDAGECLPCKDSLVEEGEQDSKE